MGFSSLLYCLFSSSPQEVYPLLPALYVLLPLPLTKEDWRDWSQAGYRAEWAGAEWYRLCGPPDGTLNRKDSRKPLILNCDSEKFGVMASPVSKTLGSSEQGEKSPEKVHKWETQEALIKWKRSISLHLWPCHLFAKAVLCTFDSQREDNQQQIGACCPSCHHFTPFL